MMRNRSLRGLELVLALTVLGTGAAGCATHRTHPYAEFDPATKGAIVIGDDLVVPDPIPASKGKAEVIHWVSFPGTTLKVVFDPPSPFPRLQCNRNRCESGPIDQNAAEKAYAYHASLTWPPTPSSAAAPSADRNSSGDPKVIIEY